MRQSIICISSDLAKTEKLVQSLKNAGFTSDDISVLMPDIYGAQELGYELHSKAPEGVSAGASAGAIVGGALGYLAGVGAILIPGAGPFIVAGPMVAALSGVAIGGTVGGVSGGLVGFGIPEYEAKKYERKVRSGSTLIAVHVDTEKDARTAEETLKNAGAVNIHRTSENDARKKSA
jgi:hypothetical protein